VQRLTTAPNQPDLQGIDPRTGRRFNVDVERNPARTADRERILREFQRVIANDPEARSVLQIIHPQTGRTLEKHVYDPLTARTTVIRNEELRRREVLDLEDW
jgi:hypothetical protein